MSKLTKFEGDVVETVGRYRSAKSRHLRDVCMAGGKFMSQTAAQLCRALSLLVSKISPLNLGNILQYFERSSITDFYHIFEQPTYIFV